MSITVSSLTLLMATILDCEALNVIQHLRRRQFDAWTNSPQVITLFSPLLL